MPSRKKPTATAPEKPRKQPLKVKPPMMTAEEWEAERNRCKVVTVDQKRRRQIKEAAEATAVAAAAMPGLGLGLGQTDGGRVYHPTTGRSTSPSSAAYFEERYESTPLSQIRFTQEIGESSGVTADTYSPITTAPLEGLGSPA